MRTHAAIGARILGGSHIPLLQLAETVAHLASRTVGRHRLSATDSRDSDIPFAGRIVAVADAL